MLLGLFKNIVVPLSEVANLSFLFLFRYSGVWLIARCGKLLELGFDVHSWNTSLILLILTGVVSRLIAYVCLVCIKKK